MIPATAAELNAAWLNGTLAGVFPRARVADCRVERIGADTGFASQVFRLRLRWDQPAPDLPATLVAKLGAAADNTHPPERLRTKYIRETAFYRELAPLVAAEVPICHAVDCDPERGRFAAVFEDLADVTFGDEQGGATRRQFEAAVTCLARLHAQWWNDPRLDTFDWLQPYGDLPAQLAKLPGRAAVFFERFGDIVPPDLRELTSRLGPTSEGTLSRVAGPPATLIHVDAHLDNFAFRETPDGTQAILFDWQGTARGLGVVDLALLLNALQPSQRKNYESDLLHAYYATLLDSGVADYEPAAFQADFRVALLRWWIGTVNGLGSPQAAGWTGRQAALVRAGIARICDAALRHDLGSRVPKRRDS